MKGQSSGASGQDTLVPREKAVGTGYSRAASISGRQWQHFQGKKFASREGK